MSRPSPVETPRAEPTASVTERPSAPDWERFVRDHPEAAAYHRFGWIEIVRDPLGLQAFPLAAVRGGVIAGVLPLVRQRPWPLPATLISLPFVNYAGALSQDADAEAALLLAAVDLARRCGAARIELRHDRPRAAAWGRREDKVRFTFDTSGGEEAMWSALPGQRRTQVRAALKEGLSEVTGGEELLDDLYAILARKWRDLGSPILPRRFFAAVLRRFADDTRVCAVRAGGRIVAAGLIHRFGTRVENPWVGALPAFPKANVLLYWTMMLESHRQGAAAFDFGRSSLDSGNHVFKSRWNARQEPLPWSVWPVEAARGVEAGRAAALLRAVWKRLPLPLASGLGPMLARRLPL